jgi:ADP-ribose diphosphatase
MKANAMRGRARIVESRRVYQGRILDVQVDRVVEPGGVLARREVVVHRGSVVVLPILADGRVLLIRQYRHPAKQALWELVAGSIEPGEAALAAAERELQEETGYRAKRLTPLLDFFPSPGFLTEKMYLIQASGLTRSQARPEADERIRARLFTRRELVPMLRSKKIRDGKTLVGLLWLLGPKRVRQPLDRKAK